MAMTGDALRDELNNTLVKHILVSLNILCMLDRGRYQVTMVSQSADSSVAR